MNRKSPVNKSLIVSLLAFTFVLFSSQTLIGKNYYFSTSSGDDTRTSTQAQSSATPWKTITKLNSFFSSLVAGDSVLFKRGETFYGGIIVAKSGTSSLPIVISAYGTGNKPVISGFASLSSWTNEGNGIYSKTVSCESKPNIVSINGVQYGMGRYPNIGTNLIIDSHVTNVSITDADLNSATTNWTGAEVVIRKNEYSMERCLISNHSGKTLSYTSLASNQEAADGYYYFIQNDLRTLDRFGEWYYNGTKIYMYFGSNSPTNYAVNVPTIDKLFDVSNRDYLTINNLSIEGAGVAGIYCSATNYVTVKNCDINFSCNDGIYFQSSYGIIDNTTINHVSQTGILSLSPFITATNNIISNCSMIEGAGNSGSAGIAINCDGSDNLYQYNSIDSVGYHGIAFSGNRTTIKNNLISNFCLNLNDGGGIYTNQNNYVGRVIEGNIVRNGIGKKGIPSYGLIVDGIYLDSFLNDALVKGNSITNCATKGIMASNSSNVTFQNNTCFDNPTSLYLFEWSSTKTVYNIKLEDNIFVAKTAKQITLELQSNKGALLPFGSANRNYYSRPIDDNATIYSYEGAVDLYWNPRTLSNWQSYSGQDANSNKSPISIIDTDDFRFEYNASKVNKTIPLPATYIDVKGTIYAGSITLLPYTSAVLIKSSNTSGCSATGNISYQVWNNIGSGTSVSDLTSNSNYPNNPTSTTQITSMEGTTNLADNFGARIAGYICAPTTGSYTFWIAGDDNCELWLSTNDQAANKQKIAYHTSYTNSREWNKFTTQKSATINLVQGQSYYIEALLKEASGGDNLAVGWLKPGQSGTIPSEVIPGSVLSPILDSQICSAVGNISYQVWNNIGSSVAVSSLTSNSNYPNNPTSTDQITSMEGTTNLADNYGARIAGFICAPATGSYTFWIAGDDNCELWLSTTDQEANKQKIAYHTSFTNSREWNKFTTQKSITINLKQGQSYYIEALLKEASGGDNIAVGWLKPGQTGTVPSEVIPGSVLSPLSPLGKIQSVLVTSVALPSTSFVNPGSSFVLLATVLPSNASNSTLTWTSSNTSVATVNNSGLVTGIAAGTASITATATDGSNTSGTCLVTVNSPGCSATGNISYQVWNNIGSSVAVSSLTSNINYPNNPTSTTSITSMEAATSLAESYGARIAGYICAPATGKYTFWIAGDDNCELWLSTNDQAANKQKIAYHTSYTNSREWNKFTTQQSVVINLVQGQSYYIEALLKQGYGGNNLAVGWLKPGQSGTVPSEVIPGTVLSPILNSPICSAVGNISYQVWNNIGSSVAVSSLTSNINYPNNPTSTTQIASMEAATSLAENYGARIAGYICAPATGNYTFWIAGDDNCELWLSTNDQAVNLQKIAYHTSYTNSREWNKFSTQKSATINLVQGQSYYIEALLKQGYGGNNLAVGWLKPGQTGTVPSEVIPGSVLSPLGFKSIEISAENKDLSDLNINLLVYPNPLGNDILNIKVENLTSTATLKIFSMTGVECHNELIQKLGIIHIDRSIFTSGIYIVKVFNDNFVKTSKLIVK